METCSDTFEITICAAEKICEIDADIIRSSNQTNRVCRARIAVFLVLYQRGWTAQRISEFFKSYTRENLNVSTVTHGLCRARKLRKIDPSFAYLCDQIKEEVIAIRSANNTVAIGLRYSR